MKGRRQTSSMSLIDAFVDFDASKIWKIRELPRTSYVWFLRLSRLARHFSVLKSWCLPVTKRKRRSNSLSNVKRTNTFTTDDTLFNGHSSFLHSIGHSSTSRRQLNKPRTVNQSELPLPFIPSLWQWRSIQSSIPQYQYNFQIDYFIHTIIMNLEHLMDQIEEDGADKVLQKLKSQNGGCFDFFSSELKTVAITEEWK